MVRDVLSACHVTSVQQFDPWRELAVGIVQGNIMDLDRLLRKQARGKLKPVDERTLKEIKDFFYSGWFVYLTLDKVDGPMLYNKLIENYETTGSVFSDKPIYMLSSHRE